MASEIDIYQVIKELGASEECTMLELVFRLVPLVEDEETLVQIIAEMINSHRTQLVGTFKNVNNIDIGIE